MHLKMLYALKDEWICDFNINFLTAPKQLNDFTFFLSIVPFGEGNSNLLVFLPEESHGQRGLVGYSLWGCQELDTTKQLTHTHKQCRRILVDAMILKTKTKNVKIIFMNKNLPINVKFTLFKKIFCR